VKFFDDIPAARREGFRPCVRCKPDEQNFLGEREEVVIRTLALLQSHDGRDLMRNEGLSGLAKAVGVTTSYLCRAFKKTVGKSVGAYLTGFETGPNDYHGSSVAGEPNDIGKLSMQAAPSFSESDVTASEWSPMSRKSPKSGLIETVATTYATPSTLEIDSPHTDPGFVSCDSKISSQGLLDNPSLTHDSVFETDPESAVKAMDSRQYLNMAPSSTSVKTCGDPLIAGFDFDDPIWNESIIIGPTG
jgi:hypothetical protein